MNANDVFISYCWRDNQQSWVDRFCDGLRIRLEEVGGRAARIWRDNKLHPADRFDDEIEAQLSASRVLVAILTPSYFNSDYCSRERDHFVTQHPGHGNRTSIVKAVKTPVDLSTYPADLASTNECKFYNRHGDSKLDWRELATDSPTYGERIDDMAKAVLELLDSAEEDGARPAVYLAESTFDVEEQRSTIRRFFEQRRWRILPNRLLKTYGTEQAIRQAIKDDLSSAQLTIHPVGSYYDSLLRIQLDESRLHPRNGDFLRLVWMPKNVKPGEEPQQKLLQDIRELWAKNPFRVLETPDQDPLSELQQLLDTRRAPEVESVAGSERPCVYVICDRPDVDAAQEVRQWFYSHDVDVSESPETWDDPLKLREELRTRFSTDDAFLIYSGLAENTWVSEKAKELIKAAGGRAQKQIAGRGIFLGDPARDSKDRLLVRIPIYKGYSPATLDDALGPFLAETLRNWKAQTAAAASK